MYQLKRTIRFLWWVATAPIWVPWILLTRFGKRLWKTAKSLWNGGVWLVQKLWLVLRLYLKYIYWIPIKFVFYQLPIWIYRKILTPVGNVLNNFNTLVAYGIYRVLSLWTDTPEYQEDDDFIEPPAPELENKVFSHCQMCRMETAHTTERISEASYDTLETCERCGSRQAGRWQDTDMRPLEGAA